MSPHTHRPQKNDPIDMVDAADTRPVRVTRIIPDRIHNPHDLSPDDAAIRNGVEHGGVQESHAETRAARGSGARKRTGPPGQHRSGRDLPKPR